MASKLWITTGEFFVQHAGSLFKEEVRIPLNKIKPLMMNECLIKGGEHTRDDDKIKSSPKFSFPLIHCH